jgi:hypothetical protein
MNFMPSPNPNLLNPNLMVLRDARASVLSERGFVQTTELAQNKFKFSVARQLHFFEPVPNWNKLLLRPVQHRHARNHLSLTTEKAARFNRAIALSGEADGSSRQESASEQKAGARFELNDRTPRGCGTRRWPMMLM